MSSSTVPITIPAARDDCRTLGPWAIERRIACGTIAEIFAARAVHEPRGGVPRYALKVLREEWHEQPLIINQFRREAELGRRIAHPHLISILSGHCVARPYYLVMPFLPGQTLEQILKQQSVLPLPRALGLCRQAAQALQALHERHILHGDVKPANLLVAPNGHATLLDLGSARDVAETGSYASRPFLGTLAYTAPEAFVSAQALDQRSDLYSLGMVLYEALTGRLPFAGADLPDAAALISAIVRGRPAPLRQLAPQVPAEVAELVHTLLRKQPERRLDSAARLVERLVKYEIHALHAFVAAECSAHQSAS